MGKVIELKSVNIQKISKEEYHNLVDTYHGLYVQELVELFERHKMKQEGYQDKSLKII